MIQSDIAWMNGKLVPFADAKVHVTAFTLHYGVAAFEGIRCYRWPSGKSAIFRLREHIERLFDSAKIFTFEIPYKPAELEAACMETLRANKLQEAYIRPLAYIGAGSLGLGARDNPIEVAVVAFPWKPLLGEEGVKNGIRVHISSFQRDHLNSAMPRAKISGQYINSILAKREAQMMGFEEAILLAPDGRVAEACGENIFIVWKGKLMTPPVDAPILPGITRDSVLTLAREAGLQPIEAHMTRDMLYTAEEIFFTGTASEVTPVREVDGRIIGDGKPGPITKRLQDTYYQCVRGPSEAHPEWLAWL